MARDAAIALLVGLLSSCGEFGGRAEAITRAVGDFRAANDALPHEVICTQEDLLDAKRQAQMAVNWGLYNRRCKASGELESESGPGSSTSFTHTTREYLQDIIERYAVRSIVDVACGDWNWMRQIDLAALGVQSYIGCVCVQTFAQGARAHASLASLVYAAARRSTRHILPNACRAPDRLFTCAWVKRGAGVGWNVPSAMTSMATSSPTTYASTAVPLCHSRTRAS
jgi:hypothetical protein